MAFDKNVPVNYTEADADEVRSNFVALAVHHKGPTAPDAPELGYVWLDDALADNWKLKCYAKNGEAAATWVSLFDHMESVPVPSSGGGGEGSTILSGESFGDLSLGSVTALAFDYLIQAASFTYQASGNRILASSITTESGFTLTDPNSITDGTPSFSTDANGLRQVTIGAGSGSGSATLEWDWSSVHFTLNLNRL